MKKTQRAEQPVVAIPAASDDLERMRHQASDTAGQQSPVAGFHEEFEGWDVTPSKRSLIAIRDPGMDQRRSSNRSNSTVRRRHDAEGLENRS